MTFKDFWALFDTEGRYRDGSGSVPVVFLTNSGIQIPGELVFKAGLCVSVDMNGSTPWSYPDGSPVDGLKIRLHFGNDEYAYVFVIIRGFLHTPEMLSGPTKPNFTDPRIVTHARAAKTFDSLSDDDRKAVIESVSRLDPDPSKWLGNNIAKIPDKPIYLLRVTPDLRAFIRILEDGNVELFEIVREAVLQLLISQVTKTGGGPK
ncbi:MAG: hypothetical protein U0744_04630 [Gemmataceae bacterium]